MRDNLELVARPEGVLETPMNKGLVCRTGPELAEDCSEAQPQLANLDDLYFITAAGYVKIGRTANVWSRIRNIQCGNPHEVDCIGVLSGRGYEELAWHAAFYDDRVRGEWFHRTPCLEDAIEKAKKGEEWWHGLMPPFEFLCENCEDIEDEDELADAYIDWHIGILLYSRHLMEQAVVR
jgi:hypothetical protein